MARFRAMLAQCERNTSAGDRDRAMLLFLFDCLSYICPYTPV